MLRMFDVDEDVRNFVQRLDQNRKEVGGRPPVANVQTEIVNLTGQAARDAVKRYLSGGTNSNTNENNQNV